MKARDYLNTPEDDDIEMSLRDHFEVVPMTPDQAEHLRRLNSYSIQIDEDIEMDEIMDRLYADAEKSGVSDWTEEQVVEFVEKVRKERKERKV